jgi:hypothetical protein
MGIDRATDLGNGAKNCVNGFGGMHKRCIFAKIFSFYFWMKAGL